MMWFIICLAAVIAAFVMWQDISPKLPSGLRLPSSQPSEVVPQAQTPSPPAEGPIDPSHWTVVSDGSDFRASREFVTPARLGATTYYPPILHFSCYHGGFYAWLDTSLRAATDASHPAAVAVRIDGGAPEPWLRGQGTILEAPHPRKLVEAVLTRPTLTATVTFDQGDSQAFLLKTPGLASLEPQIAHCAPATVAAQ